jgi:hypothetical protein
VNLPVVVEFLEQKNRDIWHLQNLERKPRNCHRIGHPVRHAVRHGAITAQRRHAMIFRVKCEATDDSDKEVPR